MGRFIRIVKADKPFKTKQQEKDERKAKRAKQKEEREKRKAAKKNKPKAQKEAPEEPPREAEPQQEKKEFAPKPRVQAKTGNRTVDGFNSLQPYMDAIVREYGGKENVADKFFESIIYANNVLLARTLGLDEEVKIDEDAEDFGLMDEPLINKPIMMHLKGLSKQHEGLDTAQEAYEAKNGISSKNYRKVWVAYAMIFHRLSLTLKQRGAHFRKEKSTVSRSCSMRCFTLCHHFLHKKYQTVKRFYQTSRERVNQERWFVLCRTRILNSK